MSGLFDLDEQGARALDETARLNPFDPGQMPMPAWAGTLDQTSMLMRGSASAGRSLMMLGAAVPILDDTLTSAITGRETTSSQDWYFENVVEGLGNDAVDAWTPDASTSGSAARTLGTVFGFAGQVAQIIGMPAVFLADAALSPSTEVVREGGDTSTALGVGAINLGVNAVGMRIPAAWGSTLTQRVASGAGANLGLGLAADSASARVLEAGGMDTLAASYDPLNPQARILDTLLGAAFGGKAHIDARAFGDVRTTRDAILAARNAEAFANRELPGNPLTPGAAVAHQDALAAAMAQMERGEPVDVARTLDLAQFALRPELTPAAGAVAARGPADYTAFRHALESGGRADAAASTSGAYGIDQFIPSTWRRVVAAAKPAWADGLSDAELLAARGDPAKSAEMEGHLRAESAAALQANGQEATAINLYASHHFGAKRGVAFARADDATPMTEILTAGQIDANPYLRGKTKAEAIANWTERARRAGVEMDATATVGDVPAWSPRFDGAEAGRIIDTRLAELDDAAGRGALSRDEMQALRREDTDLVNLMREQERLARDNILTADPTGRFTPDDVATLDARRAEIRQAIEGARSAESQGQSAARLRGRLDKIDRDADLIRLAEQLQGEPNRLRVPPRAEPARAADAPATAAKPTTGESTAVRLAEAPKPAEAPKAPAANDPDAQPAAPTQDTPRAALARLAAEMPDAAVIDGFDADGSPRFRALADALADVEAGRATAEADARAFTAAANCAMRNGAA